MSQASVPYPRVLHVAPPTGHADLCNLNSPITIRSKAPISLGVYIARERRACKLGGPGGIL